MRNIFMDAFYLVAYLLPYDQWHSAVLKWQADLRGPVRYFTTYEVLIEVLAGVAGAGSYFRDRAVATVDRMKLDPVITLVPPSIELFERDLERYRRRPD